MGGIILEEENQPLLTPGVKIKLAGIIPECVINGPGGISYTIFAQGCDHRCRGCHNPETHSFEGGVIYTCDEIIEDIANYSLSNIVTFTGGDPFFQAGSFNYLAAALKTKDYKLVAYTGFYFEALIEDKEKRVLLEKLDILIDGPFIKGKEDLALNFRGSHNQRIIDVKKSLGTCQIVLAKKYYEK